MLNNKLISVTLTAGDLQSLIEETIGKTIEALSGNTREEECNWLSPAQVMSRLDVTRPTLWRWDKEGYLRAFKFGNRVRYKDDDVKRVEYAEKGGKSDGEE